jgi:membrane protein DedA with SNARE-associated domain
MQTLLDLIATYGYPSLLVMLFVAALGIGAPIPVTLLLLTMGALSNAAGGPDFFLLALVCIPGLVAGHSVNFVSGRVGNRLLERWITKAMARVGAQDLFESAVRLRGGRALVVFLTRFLLTPIACPIGFLAGVTRMETRNYLAVEIPGTMIYVLGNLILGRLFGKDLLKEGGISPIFWIVVAVAVILPIVLVRYAPRVFAWLSGGRSQPEEDPNAITEHVEETSSRK